jgi:hypothetical protein
VTRVCNIVTLVFLAAWNSQADSCASLSGHTELVSACRPYALKLTTLFTPRTSSMGLLLKARIDGGPPLRFLLDSGAQNVFLSRHAANLSGRSEGTTMDLVGFGASESEARRLTPGTVEIGDLVLRNCEMLGVAHSLPEGIDGVIPLSLFAGFLVQLDVPGRTLHLEPYRSDSPVNSNSRVNDEGFSPARADNNLLFLLATVNESEPGYVLLDTGASYNVVSKDAAGSWRDYRVLSPNVPLLGGTGNTSGFLLPCGVRFRFGSRVLTADPAVVVDLSDFTRHHGFALAGVLGYPALSHSIVTIDYRNTLVRIDDK